MFQLLLAIIYLAFISLGLPDSLLGSAWPAMYQEFSVPVSYAGGISMIIAAGTIISSLQSDRLTRRFGTGKVTAFSVFLTAAALFGFSVSHSYAALCLWAVPYGLGAGSVDASLNNYVALHYESRHMSWLHCMWGVGASLGPYVMGYALSGGAGWNMGYRYIAALQVTLTAVLFLSLPLWHRKQQADMGTAQTEESGKTLSLREVIHIPGAKEVMITFFCYCALEQTSGLWASSYLVLRHGLSADTAAGFASLFFVGITVGRALSGFLTLKFNDTQMIRLGQGVIFFGILLLLLPLGKESALSGLVLIGLGCAPVYPSVIHSTPEHFGAEKSQAMIGVQMASAYVGTCLMPPLFGLIANHISPSLLPVYLLLILALMIGMHEKMLKKVKLGQSGVPMPDQVMWRQLKI
ncbi:MAG TPA: MFS transporter [Candidatus Lachnoclostridium pullistercoris]|uniref:MFS transporter n=1 Tax=Candidatus Lachnoclostridium pullistercoris TaxID=2838632 RepID=A0A9D2T673_9FIRM|nr:MFS transporter [Candidatus Lachnoclostridium pullistercoris]